MTEDQHRSVLVVDDDPEVLELYERYLQERYDVRTAATGESALEIVDESVDVVVLDRRLPEISGDEVLDRVRERDLDARVAIVTAVEPDFEIIEMPFDDYLVKPVRREQLLESVSHLFDRIRYSDLIGEYYRVASKVAALESAKPEWELEESEEFDDLRMRAERLREQVTDTLVELDDYVTAFSEVETAGEVPQRE